ncbi:MAG: hypothetical protein MZV63_68055 [Marinilabiliales bacterium]|nr:hypothetical protein [Marinilabiliales bacterium]
MTTGLDVLSSRETYATLLKPEGMTCLPVQAIDLQVYIFSGDVNVTVSDNI